MTADGQLVSGHHMDLRPEDAYADLARVVYPYFRLPHTLGEKGNLHVSVMPPDPCPMEPSCRADKVDFSFTKREVYITQKMKTLYGYGLCMSPASRFSTVITSDLCFLLRTTTHAPQSLWLSNNGRKMPPSSRSQLEEAAMVKLCGRARGRARLRWGV